MTTREIYDLVETRHDGVKLSIERMVLRGVIYKPSMEDGPLGAKLQFDDI